MVLNNRILEKPVGSAAAYEMLRSLSGNENHVLTAVTLASLKSRFPCTSSSSCISPSANVSSTSTSTSTSSGEESASPATKRACVMNSSIPSSLADSYTITTFCKSSVVRFDDLSDDVIHAYIESGEPFDKAGGYGMQSLGASLVTSIDGCFFNVMGFPVHKFCEELLPVLARFQNDTDP